MEKTMQLSENAVKVLEKRYLKKDKNGNIAETPEELFWRVAEAVASADGLYGNTDTKKTAAGFYSLMHEQKFMPNSPTLMNAGKEQGQLSACFVLPVPDSMEGIFEALKNAALIHKSGGGTGFSFSRLRPEGAKVKSTGGIASGPVSFMRVFNAATEAVKQGGMRRGANMGVLKVNHPDILKFIQCKSSPDELNNFNISVGITDEYIRALFNNAEYSLINPQDNKETGRLSAACVFDLIAEMAWKNGEPGVIFLDTVNKANPVPEEGEIESTNPCGEQPLLPYESCNLGSLNLNKFVIDGKVDYDNLKKTVRLAVHFLDNVIDINSYPLKEIEEATKKTRKIGLGVMGFADMLFMLNIPYNSKKAVAAAGDIMRFIQKEASASSEELAIKRGNFPLYEKSVFKKQGRRNAAVTTIAPAGTISLICQASSGIEPVYELSYYRNILDGRFPEAHPYFMETAKKRGFYSEELVNNLACRPLKEIRDIPSDIRKIFVTAHDISPKYHIAIQAAFQKHTENAVSKTINFPENASVKDVKKAFLLAYASGCKGVTIYRDKSRAAQVLEKENNKKEKENKKCPECGNMLYINGGCAVCKACGYSKCS